MAGARGEGEGRVKKAKGGGGRTGGRSPPLKIKAARAGFGRPRSLLPMATDADAHPERDGYPKTNKKKPLRRVGSPNIEMPFLITM